MQNKNVPGIEVLQARMSSGEVNSLQLVQQSLAVIEENKHLNAFISIDSAGAVSKAAELDKQRESKEIKGPLHGIPIAVKDNIHVAGLTNTAGTPALKSFVPATDALVIERLKAAGAIVIGKTNMHELAYGITSENVAFGAVGNAWNPAFFAGGSSGGTAAAIASGMVSVGLGTDTGGSSRIPASLNGLVGFRPTTGRYPSEGLTRISSTRDTVGPMGHNVADVALLDSIMSDIPLSSETIHLEGLRLGVPRDYFYNNLEADVAAAVEALLQRLKKAGVVLVEADLAQVGELNEKIGFPVVLYETKQLLTAYLAQNMPSLTLESLAEQAVGADVKATLATVLDGSITEAMYRDALDVYRPQLQQAYRHYFSEHKVSAMIFPTMPLTARPIKGSLENIQLNEKTLPTFPTYIRNTDPASNAGIPGITLPVALATNGMPIGVEIDGPENSDQTLLAIASAIERLIKNNP